MDPPSGDMFEQAWQDGYAIGILARDDLLWDNLPNDDFLLDQL